MTPTHTLSLHTGIYSIDTVNIATKDAVLKGASLAFLALEMQDIKSTGAVADAVRDHLRGGQPVRPIIDMVKQQWASGACRELIRMFGGKLLRKILNA